jgi:uncharacterized membrane protein YheB (UPF0754 family)
MSIWLLSIPLLSAFAGWFTNWFAIKMLFHPKDPVKIFGIQFQGIYPAKQEQFGEKLGKLVSEEFLSFGEFEKKIADPENLAKVLPLVDAHIDEFLHHKLSKLFPMISMFIGEKTIGSLKAAFMTELQELFPKLMQQYAGQLQKDLDIERLVADKIRLFSAEKLESMLRQALSRELRYLGLLGAGVGLLVGIIQLAIVLLSR